jgi:hypothetical protein
MVAVTAATLGADDPQRIHLVVDRETKSEWKEMNPATVFETGDHLRFRVSTNFSGFLYVMNHGSAGSYEQLFPRTDTGSDNRIEAGKEYIVPATRGWFAVGGPAGQDVVYWLVSPGQLSSSYKPLPPAPSAPPSHSPEVPSSMHPRCDDTVFKARGECIDNSAGVKPVQPGEKLPSNLSEVAGATPRALLFMQEQGGAVLSSKTPLTGPMVYELRLSHR